MRSRPLTPAPAHRRRRTSQHSMSCVSLPSAWSCSTDGAELAVRDDCGLLVDSELCRHALHPYLILPCAQILLPPHSLQFLFRLPCRQMPLPPDSLHWRKQSLLPPQSLHCCFCLPCAQILLPPHSLQQLLSFRCRQMNATALITQVLMPPVRAEAAAATLFALS
jgi:hypothetical protein